MRERTIAAGGCSGPPSHASEGSDRAGPKEILARPARRSVDTDGLSSRHAAVPTCASTANAAKRNLPFCTSIPGIYLVPGKWKYPARTYIRPYVAYYLTPPSLPHCCSTPRVPKVMWWLTAFLPLDGSTTAVNDSRQGTAHTKTKTIFSPNMP